ncbi:hypothetical protein [Kribbella swartbergensis]
MSDWAGWELGRVVLVLTTVLFAGIWVQVSLMHWAGGFKHVAMWGPVVATPLFIAAAAAGAVTRSGWFGWVLAALFAAAVLEGLGGLVFHLKGVVRQIGGWSLRNLLAGPPPVLPVAYALIGVLGLVGVMWDA